MKSVFNKRLIISALISSTFFFVGCSSVKLEKMELGSRLNCENRLLIASQTSEYKNDLISRMESSLKGEYCYLKVVSVEELEIETPEEYKAIAILDGIQFGSVSEESEIFIDRTADKSKFSVLGTKGGDDEYEIEYVDAITCASDITTSEEKINDLISSVRTTLRN